jgi:hypothetical protein
MHPRRLSTAVGLGVEWQVQVSEDKVECIVFEDIGGKICKERTSLAFNHRGVDVMDVEFSVVHFDSHNQITA